MKGETPEKRRPWWRDAASGLDPRACGHDSLAELFKELRADEAASKTPDAHGHGASGQGKDAGEGRDAGMGR